MILTAIAVAFCLFALIADDYRSAGKWLITAILFKIVGC